MILCMIPSLIFVISGDIGKKSDLFTFIPGDKVTINIHAKEKSKNPVSRYLYGKFTEHLGRNIYNGMWAQILQNPGFEGWHFWGSNYEDMSLRMKHFAERLGMTDVMDSYNRGIAPWWLLYGRGQVNYELDEESFNSQLAQKITAKSLESPQVGLRQVVFLPTHREKNYDFSLYARSEEPCRLYVGIRKAKDMDDLMVENHIDIGNKDWQRYNIELSINKALDKGEILLFTLGFSEPCTVWLDQMALFPQDNLKGFDPDVVKFTKESGLPILRYPGGNFVSGYHWKDGIGPIDKRESTANKPWNMIEYNHVGTDEFVDFCRLTGAEPMICVNAGDGTPEEAAEWLEYCNGNTSTKYGKLRAENGHPEPYNIVYWEIGNELYGNWQIGHCSPEEYAERYEKFYKAMVAVDSKIKIIANGQDMRWNAPIIKRKWDILRSLSIHTLIGGGTPENADPNEVF
ncbi:hypothetical protein FJZ33_13515, partial [Candidatus Poribacteria bacterium]|nr:hypothetical protein [Candidatus Poribacteria bacterium]